MGLIANTCPRPSSCVDDRVDTCIIEGVGAPVRVPDTDGWDSPPVHVPPRLAGATLSEPGGTLVASSDQSGGSAAATGSTAVGGGSSRAVSGFTVSNSPSREATRTSTV